MRKKRAKRTGVYSIVCVVNRKMYIGSCANIDQRWDGHKTRLKSGIHHIPDLQKDYNRYGIDAIKYYDIEVCEEGISAAELEKVEEGWQRRYNTLDSRYGYNTVYASSRTTETGEYANKRSPYIRPDAGFYEIDVASGIVIEYTNMKVLVDKDSSMKSTWVRRCADHWEAGKKGHGYKLAVRGKIYVWKSLYIKEFDYIGHYKKQLEIYNNREIKKKRVGEPVPWAIREFGRKEIVCIGNERVTYESSSAAARSLGIRQSKIADVLSGRRKSYKGYTFEYTGVQER